MGQIPLAGGDLRTIAILLGLVILGISGAVLHARHEWRMLRYKLFRPVESNQTLTLPSRLAQRLGRGWWESTFPGMLAHSLQDIKAAGNSSAAAAVQVVAQNAERLIPLVQEVALCAMTEGELRSVVVRLGDVLVYVLVCPGRHDDRRTMRRSESLARGWPAHAQAVLKAADPRESLPLLSLLYFLGLDARSGTLLVAYDDAQRSVHPAELADAANGSVPCTAVAGLSQDFVLA
jgi:hypothetical protein